MTPLSRPPSFPAVSSAPTGLLILLSGPSGSGKTTLSRRAQQELACVPSISATTRPPRPGETDGQDYHFLSPADFQARVSAGDFLEHARVHGNCYGTLYRAVLPILQRGDDVIMDIDVQGARQIRAAADPDITRALVDVFVSPPTREELRRRLSGRGTDAEEVIQQRLENALAECAAWAEYQFVIPSASHDEDWQRLLAIHRAARLDTRRLSLNFDA